MPYHARPMLLRRRPRGLASRSLAALWLALACRLDSESLTQDPSTNASTEATSMTDGATSTTAGATETSETGMSGTASESVGSTSETGETDTASSDSESGTECPEPGYTPGDAAELLADPAAFDRQKLCLEGVFQLNPNAGGCDPSTDGCCSDRPELETATGDISKWSATWATPQPGDAVMMSSICRRTGLPRALKTALMSSSNVIDNPQVICCGSRVKGDTAGKWGDGGTCRVGATIVPAPSKRAPTGPGGTRV